jgi:hypothetical protein
MILTRFEPVPQGHPGQSFDGQFPCIMLANTSGDQRNFWHTPQVFMGSVTLCGKVPAKAMGAIIAIRQTMRRVFMVG